MDKPAEDVTPHHVDRVFCGMWSGHVPSWGQPD
jgi:hypothetical protein